MSPLINLQNVSKNYSELLHSGVSDVNLEITSSSIVSIVGESGSGKTTLLKLIYGYLLPDEGEVFFSGTRVLGPSEKLIPGHDDMKMVTQELTLNLYARVFDNISSLLANTDLEVKEKLTLQTMEFLRIEHLAYKKIVELSGGEQQRVAIARAVITEPKVLLLDEPFSQIDTILKKELRDDIERLSRFLGITVVMVSHDPSDALALSDQIVVMREGKVERKGHPKEIYNDPQSAYVAKLLGKANILQGFSFLANASEKFAVYPQDVLLCQSDEAISAKVKRVHFNGFYSEVCFLVEDKPLIAYIFDSVDVPEKGSSVSLKLRNLKKLV